MVLEFLVDRGICTEDVECGSTFVCNIHTKLVIPSKEAGNYY